MQFLESTGLMLAGVLPANLVRETNPLKKLEVVGQHFLSQEFAKESRVKQHTLISLGGSFPVWKSF